VTQTKWPPANPGRFKSISEFVVDKRITYKPVGCCVLCGSNDFDIIAEKDQFGIPLETAMCNHCGLVFSLQLFSGDSAKLFYGEYYRKIYEGVAGPTLDHGFYKRLYDGQVAKVPRFIRKDSTVVELGCGGGWNLLPFKNKGINCIGFDYDGYMVQFGRERYGLNLHLGDLENALADRVRADFVIISHVLEHTEDPIEFMKGVAKILNERGLVRITVPCLDCLAYFGGAGILYSLGMALQNAHTYTFSERTLRLTLMLAGFEPVVLIRGFCLARISSQIRPSDISALQVNGANETRKILASSERWLDVKNRIHAATPRRLRRILYYLNLLPRAASVLRYFYIYNSSEV
jgi:2-polyprenyl-3-methyl-5-hydroxy-6-metoxy-1,4-benzoquinol methylase